MTNKVDQFLSWVIAVGLFVSVLLSGVIGVTTSTLMQSYSMVLMGAVCLLAGVLSSRMYRTVGLSHLIIINLAIIYFALRAAFSPSIDLGIGDMFLIFSAASVYAVVNLIMDPKLVKLSVAAILILFSANVLHYFPAVATFRDDLIPFAKGNEVSGMFNHRNFCSNLVMQASLLLLAVGVMPVSFMLNNRWLTFLIRVFATVAGAAGVVYLVHVGARGALLGLIGGSVVLFLCRLLCKKKRIFVIGLGIAAFFVVPMISYFGKVEFLRKEGIFEDRLNYFAMAVDQVPDSILVGSGSMSYSYKSYIYWGELGTHNMDHVWVHNEFLQALADYGVIGLLLLIVVLLLIFYTAILNFFHSEVNIDILVTKHVIALCVIVGFLVDSLVSFSAHSYVNLMMVAMLAAWIVPQSKKEQAQSKTNIYISRFSFLVMGAAMIYLSVPRLKAANVYADHGIYTDTLNWNPHQLKDDKWRLALEAVNQVSPNYISYSRLADLYIIEAEEGKNKKFYAEKSLKLSELALARHPFYAPAMLAKSKSLWYLGEYKLADENFETLTDYTKYRRNFYRADLSWASCLLEAGRHYLSEGDLAQAEIYFSKALNAWLPFNNDRARMNLLRSLIVLDYSKVLIMRGDYDGLDKLMHETFGSSGIMFPLESPNICISQARIFSNYGHSLYMRRKPSLAYKYFIWAEQNYSHMERAWKTEFSEGDLFERDKIKRVVSILKEGRVQPAK